jgi:ubiquinone/menaquinone biosynthesis C-methylase UbiE
MADRLFEDADLAALYDAWSPREVRSDYDFHFPMVMAAEALLDVGCGTGSMLHEARDAGHAGRLVGLDPAGGMLAQARKRRDIDWIQGDLAGVDFDAEFDLVVMTGHAFQVLVTDDEVRAALAAIHRALKPGGRFAFETRNPAARAWERWTPEFARTVTPPGAEPVRIVTQVIRPFDGTTLTFTHTFSGSAWPGATVSESTLRFLDAPTLSAFLAGAGFIIEALYGDFDGSPLTDASPEIVVLARRA